MGDASSPVFRDVTIVRDEGQHGGSAGALPGLQLQVLQVPDRPGLPLLQPGGVSLRGWVLEEHLEANGHLRHAGESNL